MSEDEAINSLSIGLIMGFGLAIVGLLAGLGSVLGAGICLMLAAMAGFAGLAIWGGG